MMYPNSWKSVQVVADQVVDGRVGVLAAVVERRADAGQPKFFHYFGQLCNTASFSRQRAASHVACSSSNRDRGLAGAILRGIAYYAAAVSEAERPILGSAETLGLEHAEPSTFALFSPEQYEEPGFPWVPFEQSTPIRWAAAVEPLSGRVVHVPAAMTYFPYEYVPGGDDAPITPATPAGLGCDVGLSEASVEAICDVVARDALAIVWRAGLPMPQVRIETLSDENYELVSRFEGVGSAVTLFDLRMDLGIPVSLAAARSEEPGAPSSVLAGAAALSGETAIRKCLEKLAETYYASAWIKKCLPAHVTDPPHENVISQADHLNFWASGENAHLLRFLFQSDERVEFEEIPNRSGRSAREDLITLLDLLESAGCQALLRDLTPSDVRGPGFFVVRAIIPGFCPLFVGHSHRSLGGTRFAEIVKGLKGRSIAAQQSETSLPHPFLIAEVTL